MAERFDFATNRWTDDPTAIRRASEPPLPTTEPRVGAWTRPPTKVSLPIRIAQAGMTLSAAAFVLLAILSPGISMVIALWVGIVCLFAHSFMTEEKSRPSDLSLFEDPGDADVFVVVVRISPGTLPSAEDTDRGVAWFSDGKLFFNGRRTSFVIGGEDVLPNREWAVAYDATRGGGIVVPLRTRPQRYQLDIMGLPGKGPAEKARYEKLDDALRAFRDHPRASDGLGRQWPPFERWKPGGSQAA